jgi:hypothetical protein
MLENVQADDQTQVRITGSGGGDAGRRFKNLITSRAEFQSDDGADARLTVICAHVHILNKHPNCKALIHLISTRNSPLDVNLLHKFFNRTRSQQLLLNTMDNESLDSQVPVPPSRFS